MPRLRAYLDEHPADLVISVFATGASAVSVLADRYPAMSHVVFCTDVTPHRLWVHPNVDMYLVTSPVAEAAVRGSSPGRGSGWSDAGAARLLRPAQPRGRPGPASACPWTSGACC